MILMWSVKDYYKNPLGERIFESESYKECEKFCDMYEEEVSEECDLVIVDKNGKDIIGQKVSPD